MMINRTWESFERHITKESIAIIPVGSIEQHGFHAPLGTDLIIAEAFAANYKFEDHIFVLPPIPVGVSDYHRHFPGSLWVSSKTLVNYVGEIIQSLSYQNVKKILIVNGHGGNIEPLRELARYQKKDFDVDVIVWTWFKAIENQIIDHFHYLPPLHADEVETSLLFAVVPHLINKESIQKSEEEGSPNWGIYMQGNLISTVVKDFSKSGATGKPTQASIETGEMLFQLANENLRRLVNEFMSR